MQVKVCPKCRAQNRPTTAACAHCYASLEDVAVTESSAPPVRTQARPKPSKQAARTATAPPPAATQQMKAPQQTQMGAATMGPPPGMPPHHGITPVKRRSMAGVIALVVFLVLIVCAGLGFAVVESGIFKPKPRPTGSPASEALKFLEAKKSGDLAQVKPYLSRHSIDMLNNTFGTRQAQSAGFGAKDAADMLLFNQEPTARQMRDKQIAATELKDDKEADSDMAIVSVNIDRKAEAAPAPKPLLAPGASPPPDQQPEQHIDVSSLFDAGPIRVEFVLVAEDGKWKVDLAETNRRALGLGKPGNPFKLGN